MSKEVHFTFDSDAIAIERRQEFCVQFEIVGLVRMVKPEQGAFELVSIWDTERQAFVDLASFPEDEQLKIKAMGQEFADEYACGEYDAYVRDMCDRDHWRE